MTYAQMAPSTTMQHVRYLAETIGPRGSTTPEEAQAADYAYQVMEDAGLQPVKETFTSPRSAWRLYALASALALAAEALFLFTGQVGAIAASMLMTFVLGSVLLELIFEDNPLRWALPKGLSQNVWAPIPAAGRAAQRVVIVGHLDTHRTPKVFSTPRWLRIFRLLIPLGLAAMAISILLFFAGVVAPEGSWRSLSILVAIVTWQLSVLTFEADYTPYTAGANDNATGAGIVLSLAARLQKQPLQHTEVWALCSGCEEVGAYGAADFVTRHRAELAPTGKDPSGNACFITLDSVGGANARPCYLAQHTFLTTAHGDPELLRLADEIAARRPELGARKVSLSGAYTEGHIAAKAGLRVLTLVGLNQDGLAPHWHQPTDVVANLDGAVIQNTETFTWELLQALDQALPASAYSEGG